MTTVPRRTILILMLISIAAVGSIGIRGYQLIYQAKGFSDVEVKYYAETLLYIALVCIVLISAVFLAILLKSRRILKELDKIIDLTRIGNISIEEPLKKIGRLGEKIRILYYHINALNEKRSLKISSLTAINSFLLNNIEMSLLMTDVTGTIVDSTRRYLEKNGLEKAAVIGHDIKELFPDVEFEEIVKQLTKEHKLIETPSKERPSFFPIFNSLGELSNVLCIVGKEKLFTGVTLLKTEKTSTASKLSNFMKKMISPNK